ncbi:MAG: Protein GrpE [Turneriella sp.]|nr:Protein GrpE [Turneriella sp.]
MTEERTEEENKMHESAGTEDEQSSQKIAEATNTLNDASKESTSVEIDTLKAQIESLTSSLQRERAEFTNFRKRALTEKEQQAALTTARLLNDLLPALDAFDQFFIAYSEKSKANTDIQAIVEGVELVQKQIVRVFSESGVEEFNPVGEEFDPTVMEALTLVEGDVPVETVMQVFQKGYRIQGKLIRAARVVVAKPKTPAEANAASEENKVIQ